ncbi:BTAD domain-containing putative transcriptional regulator [Pseudarthrobacter sp. BRE9]|uniref:AfsR/SARP family transcriptional regulator n=1 Tax=Pseudarthrobacter sp. BRE9 TaxID=2962582 RepID=UPI0028829A2D|nr:BTAD domain-containing putative transcriptional regulator [Pseudarthrobacter sp. BRE9]MDT0168446.1 BTAD domain-containing putative transcriptional regulator [Pseudarthrobacter sp. BRE9]
MGIDDCGMFELDLMRAWRIRRQGEAVRVAARQQRLIAALAVRGASFRNYLAGVLWPECPEANALESLRMAVHLTTRQLPGLLVKDGALLSLDRRVDVDLYRVRGALKKAQTGSGGASDLLQEIRDVDFLPGWYEDWVVFEQSRLQHDRLRALIALSQRLAACENFEAASEAATAALEIEPLYEGAVRLLVMAEMAQGNVASAFLAYERYEAQLHTDIGVSPSEGLRQLIPDGVGRHSRVPAKQLIAPRGSSLSQEPLLHNA